MSTYSRGQLIAELIRDENEVLRVYDDKTGAAPLLASGGKITAGVGHNLTDNGISLALSRQWLDEDIAKAEGLLDLHTPWFRQMTDARQRGLLNMVFNMGWSNPVGTHGLVTFKNSLALLQAGRYDEASMHFLQSAWANQVGMRAVRISEQFRVG